MIDIGNLGKAYYQDYFESINLLDYKEERNSDKLKGINKKIFEQKLAGYEDQINLVTKSLHKHHTTISLITTYPGLLMGSGYLHEIGLEGELKLGLSFDHTTGLPCIPGSSVKGVLRNAFFVADGRYVQSILDDIRSGEREVSPAIKEMIEAFVQLGEDKLKAKEDQSNSTILDAIFSGIDEHGEPLKSYNRDVFLDAFPVESQNKNGEFLSNDYITPHINRTTPEMSPFTDPVPLQFMKVLPNVSFQFNFILTDQGLKKELKMELFRQILLDLGIGAKTNVGYGQLDEEFMELDTRRTTDREEEREVPPPPVPQKELIEGIPPEISEYLKAHQKFSGKILEKDGAFVFILFKVIDTECVIRKSLKSLKTKDKGKFSSMDEIDVEDQVIVSVNNDYQYPTPLNCGVKLINK